MPRLNMSAAKPATKRQWISIGDTHLLMQEDTTGIIPEWNEIGKVTRRQVYESLPPKWYAFNLAIMDEGFLGRFGSFEEAVQSVERAATS